MDTAAAADECGYPMLSNTASLGSPQRGCVVSLVVSSYSAVTVAP